MLAFSLMFLCFSGWDGFGSPTPCTAQDRQIANLAMFRRSDFRPPDRVGARVYGENVEEYILESHRERLYAAQLEEQESNSNRNEVESGLAEDMLGLGQDELSQGPNVDYESSFFMGLGTNEKERKDKLNELVSQLLDWRPHIFRALQLALRDVRSYGYDQIGKKWIPNNRQAKRPAPQLDPEDSPLQDVSTEQNVNENEDLCYAYAYAAADYGTKNFL